MTTKDKKPKQKPPPTETTILDLIEDITFTIICFIIKSVILLSIIAVVLVLVVTFWYVPLIFFLFFMYCSNN